MVSDPQTLAPEAEMGRLRSIGLGLRESSAGIATAQTAIVVVGLCVTTLLVFLVLTAGRSDLTPLIVGPGLFLLSLPLLRREAASSGDSRLYAILVIALAAKFVGALVRHFVGQTVYLGQSDSTGYFNEGVQLASQFRAGDFTTDLPSLTGTDFLRFLSGLVYTVIPPSLLTGFLVFAWLGFWGQVFFCRAYRIAVPEGRSRAYAYWVLFLPSLVYWPSSIGKEAWMMLALGLAALGAAHVLSGRAGKGLIVAGLGMWLAAFVRPPLAGMVALGLGVAVVLRPVNPSLRQIAPIAKVLSLATAAVLAVAFVGKAQEFLGAESLASPAAITQELKDVSERADKGGSKFTPSVVRSPTDLPTATLTVLFRPLITEAHNAQARAAAAESAVLLLVSIYRFPWIVAAIRSGRRQPYVIFALVYVALFVVAFSAFPNFGLLARQRVQVLPLLLVLLTVPPRRRNERRNEPRNVLREEVAV